MATFLIRASFHGRGAAIKTRHGFFLWTRPGCPYNRFFAFHHLIRRPWVPAKPYARVFHVHTASDITSRRSTVRLTAKNEKQLLQHSSVARPDAGNRRFMRTASTHDRSPAPSGVPTSCYDDCWESTEASFKEAFSLRHPAPHPSLQFDRVPHVARDSRTRKVMTWWAADRAFS